ncbi:DUF4395 domain-containing protein [Peribacillus alkalitolerans]|uniref:DUF4395 domain-containing protein n=1 Tax=Peribacillus alkalitolerans TaxID=1550385 RepID=UPI0013D3F93A|nr:DUF4395 domain-containing protein [Peribacillus alkalitolerans]
MTEKLRSIPRPLVKVNQWTIVLSVISTWISGWEWFLIIPLISGLLGLLFGYNPVMELAKTMLKKELKSYIPEDWEQQQFNQKIAVSCLLVAFVAFLIGWNTVGYIFSIIVALAAFVAILGFCVGCFMHYQWKRYMYRRAN